MRLKVPEACQDQGIVAASYGISLLFRDEPGSHISRKCPEQPHTGRHQYCRDDPPLRSHRVFIPIPHEDGQQYRQYRRRGERSLHLVFKNMMDETLRRPESPDQAQQPDQLQYPART